MDARGWCKALGVALLALALMLTGSAAAAGQLGRWLRGGDAPEVEYDNVPWDGRFTFARVRFNPSFWSRGRYAWGLDLKWNHDYPRGDRRLSEILDLVTGVRPNRDGSNIVGIGDPELFGYPWAYLCEVGFLTLTQEEAENFRNYLLKGGFVVVDDFVGGHFYNFESEMRKVLPDVRFFELDSSHQIFHAFFDIDDLGFGGPYYGFRDGGMPRYFGVFEDNDPNKRLMMIVNYDNDIGEFWEFADSPYIDIDLSNDAFKLGVNYVLYSMLH